MAIDSDIRDQAYQFFIQEALDLLQVIETELITLQQDSSTSKIHNMMRAAHSIKGGAASVDLAVIKQIAHRLEDGFKALHHDELQIDAELETLFLQAFDCLKTPLMDEIETGYHDAAQAEAQAEPALAALEKRLEAFLGAEAHLPSSVELGVDIAKSIFEVDVAEGLDRLAEILASNLPSGEVASELRAQAEVFIGISELLNLSGFAAIAETAIAAISAHPLHAIAITQTALANFRVGHQAVLSGDRSNGGAPSEALLQWLSAPESSTSEPFALATPDLDALWGDEEPEFAPVSEILRTPEFVVPELEMLWGDEEPTFEPVSEVLRTPELLAPNLDALWGDEEPAIAAEPEPELEPDQPVQDWINAIAADFENLPPVDQKSLVPAPLQNRGISESTTQTVGQTPAESPDKSAQETDTANQLMVRVPLDRLEQMSNQVGELVINRNSLSLQNQLLQKTVQELLRRFNRFQGMAGQLRSLSDQMLVAERPSHLDSQRPQTPDLDILLPLSKLQAEFDSLEMDSYSELHQLLQSTLEEVVQLEETTGDINLLSKQSTQSLSTQRQMLSRLQEDLMWARMLPIGQILSRFPRVLRDLAVQHHKPVELKLSGTSVLVDKAALEQLSSPLMHILRNAFDHGIEPSEVRKQQGKPEQGQISIRAYHRGNQTIIEVQDDGQGIKYERIRDRAIALGWASAEQVATLSKPQLIEFMFQPGFSTAAQVTDLSGRGVGLDVVRSQLQALKGKVSVTSEEQQGTTFTLRIPLTLTINKLLVCLVGPVALAFPSDSIEEILVPKPSQVKGSAQHRFLHWRGELVPMVALADVLDYACPLPAASSSQALTAAPTPEDWALPLLMLRQGKEVIAVEVNRIVTEQELVIKPYGRVLAAPSYLYGCTTLGDGSLVPVLDSSGLFDQITQQNLGSVIDPQQTFIPDLENAESAAQPIRNKLSAADDRSQSILIVDDSIALRQTLALTLQKAGHRVLQARDGREALDQLQQNPQIQMVVCDIEMPNMNGFEFLSHRRQNPDMLKVPVAMLTSRSNDKHRRLALHLGANAYFVKPYIEQEFLSAIAEMMQKKQPVGVS